MRAISDRKIREITQSLQNKGIDAAIFVNREPIIDMNIAYLTGFFNMFDGALLFSTQGSTLITTTLDYERAVQEAKVNEIINAKNSFEKSFIENLKDFKTVGIAKNVFPLNLMEKIKKKLPTIRFLDISKVMLEARSVKDVKEIELIRKSASIANYGIKVIEDILSTKKRMKEKELAARLEYELKIHNADVSFKTIVVSGIRSAYVHPYPNASNKFIERGLGLVDFGTMYEGYIADVTVPFVIGNLNSTQKRMIITVQKAYNEAISAIKPGISVWKLYKIAADIINKVGFKFKHSLGHGVGLEVHEFPMISDSNKEIKLKEGMIFTIEPGVYVPNMGGCRLENDALVTKNGCEILTSSKLIKM